MVLIAIATACIAIALEIRQDSLLRLSLLGDTSLQGGVEMMVSSEVSSSFNVDVDVVEVTIVGPDRRVVVAAAGKSVAKAGVMPVDAVEGTIDSLRRRSSVLTTMV